ncbi:MAG TPA: hypothetical protein VHE56_12020 [Mycobacteriales bacterium]|nr:hypothetical protein [Mycobacteriales bacterium]
MTSELRVMSLDARAVARDPDAVRAAVASRGVDVVAFHEAPRYLRWRSKRAKLARQLGMVVVTADRPGGMFVVTSLRADVLDQTFTMSSSSAGSSPAVVIATLEVRGGKWRVVVAATGGAPDIPDSEIPAVIVGGSGTIGVSSSLTVVSCDPVDLAGSADLATPMFAVVRQ